MPTERRRQELLGIAALLVGVFLALTLLPWDLTGAVGRGTGRALWKYLGVGAVLLAALCLGAGLAALGRLARLGPRRVSGLAAGLTLLIPYAIAVVSGVRTTADFAADYAQWPLARQLVGIVPGMLAVGVTTIVGTAGAVAFGVLSLSALTLFTLDWHPFRRLARAAAVPTGETRAAAEPTVPRIRPFAAGEDTSPEEEPDEPPPRKRRAPRAPAERKSAPAADAGDELPSLDLLDRPEASPAGNGDQEFDRLGQVLIDTLATFRVGGKIVDRTTGPVVTRFEVSPDPGVKVGRIASLADDLALAMRAQSIRIVAPIPGKAAVGIEVPNPTARIVTLRELLDSDQWAQGTQTLPVALGRDLEGRPIISDLAKMPHLLIAGATGSGKSVCINTIITSLIYAHTPDELRLLMIDPKMVELSVYGALPHLRHPVVTNNHKAATVFKWAVREMDRRYGLLNANHARNINDFNKKVRDGKPLVEAVGEQGAGSGTSSGESEFRGTAESPAPRSPLPYIDGVLPYIVLIVDELADLMLTVQGEVERPLAILAQKARATGLHIILATQRPSVNVITGLIKANFSCRIAFRVSAKVDSRTILDQNGAETLLGNGDMLFLPPGKSEPQRIQGAFIGTEETERLMEWFKARPVADRMEADILEQMAIVEAAESAEAGGAGGDVSTADRDPRFREAAELCIQHQLGSTSLLQRRMSIGYGRAARIIDQLHDAGILGPPDGSKPREVLIGLDQLDTYA